MSKFQIRPILFAFGNAGIVVTDLDDPQREGADDTAAKEPERAPVPAWFYDLCNDLRQSDDFDTLVDELWRMFG